jgi:flagellar motor switch protein FliG
MHKCLCWMIQVIRVKWSLHAREEILYELMSHLRGKDPLRILDRVRQSTRDMLVELEAVRDRIFTVQDVMQSTVRAVLQVLDLVHLSYWTLNQSIGHKGALFSNHTHGCF